MAEIHLILMYSKQEIGLKNLETTFRIVQKRLSHNRSTKFNSINLTIDYWKLAAMTKPHNIILETDSEDKTEQQHDKTNKMSCAPSEDSDQLGHPPRPHEETLGP